MPFSPLLNYFYHIKVIIATKITENRQFILRLWRFLVFILEESSSICANKHLKTKNIKLIE